MFLISLFVGGILIVSVGSSPWWLPAVFGSRFSAFLGDFAIYMVITSFSVVLVTINPLFMALGLVKENFIIQFFANSTFLIFAWFGANLWGLRGVLLAFGGNILISHFSKMIIIARRYGLCRK
jgi:O-antigen/teichoic acid export membrane protein